MSSLLANKYSQAILVFVLIVGGYALYVNLNYTETKTGEVVPVDEVDEAVQTNTPMENMEAIPSDETNIEETLDLKGTHIMPDGTVMTGAGVTLPDATISDDGMIVLPDGTTLVPAIDMRPKPEMD